MVTSEETDACSPRALIIYISELTLFHGRGTSSLASQDDSCLPAVLMLRPAAGPGLRQRPAETRISGGISCEHVRIHIHMGHIATNAACVRTKT